MLDYRIALSDVDLSSVAQDMISQPRVPIQKDLSNNLLVAQIVREYASSDAIMEQAFLYAEMAGSTANQIQALLDKLEPKYGKWGNWQKQE
ncbi:hypothetical protein EDC44_1093 [Cricetibacter osteomyelitidis]|uniref:Uncharacterized protein n=1 Tax=Cricetibacter osteomyelitidis TaxID=1521931 RepID=A0A4R2TKC5_9PAST|nr:hypothetical protein [Cricetibacter osteomyelitidis]TCP95312.1 hypothetical protein EDC44_1093 [Cricetibacter osteomyelitidis]